jgi:hypothetical protein
MIYQHIPTLCHSNTYQMWQAPDTTCKFRIITLESLFSHTCLRGVIGPKHIFSVIIGNKSSVESAATWRWANFTRPTFFLFQDVEKFAERRRQRGVNVSAVRFDDSPHVKHFSVHREIYINTVCSFLHSCLSGMLHYHYNNNWKVIKLSFSCFVSTLNVVTYKRWQTSKFFFCEVNTASTKNWWRDADHSPPSSADIRNE